MLTDRMGPVAKLSNRRILKDLEEKYAKEHPAELSSAAKKEPKRDAKKKLRK